MSALRARHPIGRSPLAVSRCTGSAPAVADFGERLSHPEIAGLLMAVGSLVLLARFA